MVKIFISYSHKDNAAIRALKLWLMREDYRAKEPTIEMLVTNGRFWQSALPYLASIA